MIDYINKAADVITAIIELVTAIILLKVSRK